VEVTTIGFTKTSAEQFFERLRAADVRTLIDVRISNNSQLAGFAKVPDLRYFLSRINNITYQHAPLLAPTKDMLAQYRKGAMDWGVYQGQFLKLMSERQIENRYSPSVFHGACLLCSEAEPHQCHRRLVCDYLNEKWGQALKVRHL
jgi:uncharacterized protein (DUF488 family)